MNKKPDVASFAVTIAVKANQL